MKFGKYRLRLVSILKNQVLNPRSLRMNLVKVLRLISNLPYLKMKTKNQDLD